jgi:hypothetical protein
MVVLLLIPAAKRACSSVVATVALGAVAAAGCGGSGAEGPCTAIDACGGDPTGSWQIAGQCQYAPSRPTQPTDVNDFMSTPPIAPTLAPPQPQPTQLAATTSGDWCSFLDYNMNTVNNVSLWHDAPHVQPGTTVWFDATNYQAVYLFSTAFPGARNTTHFAPVCLTANGGSPTCADLTTALIKFYPAGNAAQPVVPTAPAPAAPPPTFGNIQCVTSPVDKGCDCTYVYQLQVVDQGTWSKSGGTISQESSNFAYNGQVSKLGSPAQTVQASYCQKPGTSLLQLSGANGESLSNLPGLRTILFQKM